jgi:L-ascorbate metabolism protein UlaG (beta-lactamase superfamily)
VITVKGLRITMTEAIHSSSFDDNGLVYLGEPAGFVVKLENGQAIYFAGDTALFSDMKLIAELYKPDIAFLPIGDRFTMGPDTAAMAARWLGVRQIVPMHWGTFPLLTGTPEMLKQHLAGSDIEVLALEPGQTSE